MHTVKVMASSPYEVIIDKGILARCGELVKAAAGGSRSLIVSDSNVAPLYLAEVKSSLESQGYEVCSHIVPAGEESKNFMQLIEVINTAAEAHLSRNDVVVALGGGMVGDLAGFIQKHCAASASAQRMPSIAADTMPPAKPAPSPQG